MPVSRWMTADLGVGCVYVPDLPDQYVCNANEILGMQEAVLTACCLGAAAS